VVTLTDSYFLKKQLIAETNETLRIKELNLELMENLSHMSHWILKYCTDYGIEPPNLDKLLDLIRRSHELIENMDGHQISPKYKHPNFTPDDSTEQNFTLSYLTFYRKPSIMI
jgi:hypothetical protein